MNKNINNEPLSSKKLGKNHFLHDFNQIYLNQIFFRNNKKTSEKSWKDVGGRRMGKKRISQPITERLSAEESDKKIRFIPGPTKKAELPFSGKFNRAPREISTTEKSVFEKGWL